MPQVTGTLTAAQVKTLNATPVSVISAPGAGKFIRVKRAYFFLDFESAGYDSAAANDDLVLRYTNASGDILTQPVPGEVFGAATDDAHHWADPADEFIPLANAAVVAHITTGEWYSAAGDSPIKYRIDYTVEPVLS